ncbi:MAG TPA: hypothetical protein VFS43_43230 [Polyangiaceae bacterium]|nr:hypothetical protein [Polyangiaceae bacterium]
MRLRFDELFKQLLTAAFAPEDRVERNAELAAADAQKVDLRLEPRHEGADNRARAGLLGRFVGEGPCHLEHFSEAPSVGELLEAVRKLLTERRGDAVALRLVLLCAGRPDAALAALGFAPAPGELAGVYRLPPGWATSLVVLSELPPRPETLLLRLLGRGATFRAALVELAALPPGTWVRRVAGPVLTRLRFALQAAKLDGEPMNDEEVALMTTGEQLYQEWEQRTREQGLSQGLAQGREQGLSQGREQVLSRQFARRLGRALGEAEAQALRARLASLGADRLSDVVLELEGDALARWLVDPNAS